LNRVRELEAIAEAVKAVWDDRPPTVRQFEDVWDDDLQRAVRDRMVEAGFPLPFKETP
jgi:hypothetical protein